MSDSHPRAVPRWWVRPLLGGVVGSSAQLVHDSVAAKRVRLRQNSSPFARACRYLLTVYGASTVPLQHDPAFRSTPRAHSCAAGRGNVSGDTEPQINTKEAPMNFSLKPHGPPFPAGAVERMQDCIKDRSLALNPSLRERLVRQFAGGSRIQMQRMRESQNALRATWTCACRFRVIKLLRVALHAPQMIVMAALVHSTPLAGFEMMALEDAGLLECVRTRRRSRGPMSNPRS